MTTIERLASNVFPKLTLGAVAVTIAAMASAGCGTRLDSRVVQVDGHAVEVATAGSGSRTVVFESGLGSDWTSWDMVAGEVSLGARVFAYSRPGYGRSDPSTTPRDAAHIVEELRALLAAQGYAPPYVLVGHSFGGTYMELFAKAHPEEVAGLVLVEPRHRDFTTTCEKEAIEGCSIPASTVASLPAVQVAELDGFAAASGQIHDAGGFGGYPVRVLTATSHWQSLSWEALWRRMNRSLANEADDGRQTVFDGTTHALQVERAHEVTEVILDLVRRSR